MDLITTQEAEILEHYGIKHQLNKLTEEMAELQIEVSKYSDLADHERITKLLEELADVEVLLDQVKLYFGCNDFVDSVKEQKVLRQLERIDIEKAETKGIMRNTVLRGLGLCTVDGSHDAQCEKCPYNIADEDCARQLMSDALDLLRGAEDKCST